MPTNSTSESTRNSKALDSFVAYCEEHPNERFWQALRNWSKFEHILGYSGDIRYVRAPLHTPIKDTFNIEGLDGTR